MHIGWPQGILLGLISLNIFCAAMLNGQPRTGNHDLALKMLDGGIIFGLLYWGGFFK